MLMVNIHLARARFFSNANTLCRYRDLKDQYAGSDSLGENLLHQNVPEVLKAILLKNPNVFKQPSGKLIHLASHLQQISTLVSLFPFETNRAVRIVNFLNEVNSE